MPDYSTFIHQNLHHLPPSSPVLPSSNPTFRNPPFEEAACRVLVARLSPWRDVDRSLPHLFLFHEVRRALPDAYVDLSFFPSAAERELFEGEGIPFLLGTQSLRPAAAFDLVLVSNSYALELINLPLLLLRSDVPLFAGRRGPEWPLLILGGSNALAAQAIVREDGDALVDAIFFGEGEGLVGELVRRLAGEGRQQRRAALARAAEEMPGLWVAGSTRVTVKAVCEPAGESLPTEYPLLDTPEARTARLQISYGCPAFCSFCLEGYDRKPYREVPLPDLLAAAGRVKQAQGVEELDLYGFNFNTHADVLPLLLELNRLFARVSFKSQRLDVLHRTPGLLEAEVTAGKDAFTLGLEGISERQRAWLHKSLSTGEIAALLDRLLAQPVRRVKLFYVLTGHETNEDVREFRRFVKDLKQARRAHNSRLRVIFSVGLLVRQPGTPLQYDRLMLEEGEWKPLIGGVKSACETNGFEFRLAFDWPAYCVSQVLALGGHWLIEPLVALAREGYCFDTALDPAYWDALRRWMERAGHWNDTLLGEKDPGYAFPLSFVRSHVPDAFLYRQFQEAQAGTDEGYCLGSADRPGRCLGCGACRDDEERRAITHHRPAAVAIAPYLAQLGELMARKRRLRPAYYVLRLPAWTAGADPALLDALALKEILAARPELVDNLLSVRESLFGLRPNDRCFPGVSGESVFGLTALDGEALGRALAGLERGGMEQIEVVGPAEGFTPGAFTRFHLELFLPRDGFPDARAVLEAYLRGAYVPYSLRRQGAGYTFDLPPKALKKKVLYGGSIEAREDGLHAGLEVGRKFDLGALLGSFGGPGLVRHARARASGVAW